jgi:hypothetical protein
VLAQPADVHGVILTAGTDREFDKACERDRSFGSIPPGWPRGTPPNS